MAKMYGSPTVRSDPFLSGTTNEFMTMPSKKMSTSQAPPHTRPEYTKYFKFALDWCNVLATFVLFVNGAAAALQQ